MSDSPMFPKMQSTDQLKKDIWNEAIEAVLNLTNEKWFIELPSKELDEIRKLKR